MESVVLLVDAEVGYGKCSLTGSMPRWVMGSVVLLVDAEVGYGKCSLTGRCRGGLWEV